MKNFKLLLASTAILSTGALAVMADTTQVASTELYAYINMVEPASISMNTPLHFGIVSNLTENQWLKIDANDGSVTGDATRIGDNANRGDIEVSNARNYTSGQVGVPNAEMLKLVMPTEIRMTKNGTGLCGYVEEIAATDNGVVEIDGGSYKSSFRIGGKFTAKAKTGEEFNSFPGECSGHGTVTLVLGDD